MLEISTEKIIINYLNENQKIYFSLNEIQELCGYVYQQLVKQNLLEKYFIKFSVDIESIEKTVLYNHKIFCLNDDGIAYFCNPKDINSLVFTYKIDSVITDIIKNFKNKI